ncbi:MAG: flavoprotein [Bacteroidota bacterium]|nr:flavoprotein [Bacteroidota bacterium]
MNILLGVCGSIAAYKSAQIVREFIKAKDEVKVIMTKSSTDFITPLTLSTLSKNPVYTDMYNSKTGEWVNHVQLSDWADVYIIAPLSANTLAKLAAGLCDNLMMATYLSCICPVVVAPAMDRDMFLHAATQNNLKTIESYGNLIIPPEEGELASGLVGVGRMAEPIDIYAYINKLFV